MKEDAQTLNAKFVEQQEETLKQSNEYQVNTKNRRETSIMSLFKLRGFSLIKNFLAREPCLLSPLNINYLEPVFIFWPGERERIGSHSFQGNRGGH